MQIIMKKIDELSVYIDNARYHSKEQIEKLKNSIVQFGFTNPILIDESNVLIAGHGRLAAAKMAKMSDVPCIVIDYLTDEQKKAYRIADNKIAIDSEWDDKLLLKEITELNEMGFDLSSMGFSEKELERFFGSDQEEPEEDECEIEIVEPITKKGDVWILGNHRVMCGDSIMIDDVQKLMDGKKAGMVFTDPPYGVSASGARSKIAERDNIKKIENDDLRGEDLRRFILDCLTIIPLTDNASCYVCYDQKSQHEFSGALKDIKLKQKSTIVWRKNNFGLSGQKGYRPQFELIAFCHVGESYQWFGENDQSDVWEISREATRHGNHPTPKPVELIDKALINSSSSGMIIADMFGGSGSTLIACEKRNRVCYMMELSEVYCDVIVKRWQNLTKKDAILESSGEKFNDCSRRL